MSPGRTKTLDALADLPQHLVAEVVSPAVVDPLEVVEVDVEQPGRVPLGVTELDRVFEPLVEEGAVRQAGQRVVQGELPQLLLRLPLARDVEEVAVEVERLPVLVDDDHALVAEMDDPAIAGDEAVLEAGGSCVSCVRAWAATTRSRSSGWSSRVKSSRSVAHSSTL